MLNPSRSITLRISLLFSGLAASVLLLMGYLVLISVNHHFVEQDTQAISGKLELIQNVLGEYSPENRAGIVDKLRDALVGHHELSVQVMDGQETVFHSGHSHFPLADYSAPMFFQSGQWLVLQQWQQIDGMHRGVWVTLNDNNGNPRYQVAIAIDAHHHTGFMRVFKLQLILVGCAGLAVLAGLGWLVAWRGLQPVSAMARVAEGISAQRLEERLQLTTLPAELHSLAISFNDMLDRLEGSLQRLSGFASDIAHELRTPINNLMTQTQVSLSRHRTAEEYREILYSNLEEYERLARMIADMLFLAKADNGLVIPRREQMELAEEMLALFEFYEALAAERNLHLQAVGAAQLQGDKLMIQRALGNLLTNAIRHASAGSTIKVTIVSGNENADIAICNQGDTIAPAQLERIFDRFYRADAARVRSDEGAGLGLAITRSIVMAHGGSIGVESSDGHTCFQIRLPLV